MGINYKFYIIALGAVAGFSYYMHLKRKRLKMKRIQIIQDLDYESLLNAVSRAYGVDDDDTDETYDFNDLFDNDSDSLSFISPHIRTLDANIDDYLFEDIDDFLNDLSDESEYFPSSRRPRYIVPKKHSHRQRNKKSKLKRRKTKETSEKEEPFNDKCPICAETLDETPFLTLDCNHSMHNACAFRMARSVKNLKCPLCRKEVEIAE